MKSLAKLHKKPGIWMHDAPTPSVGPNDLLIKINKTAICGTDMHIYQWDEWSQNTIPVPMVVGHEYVGVVVDKVEPNHIASAVKKMLEKPKSVWLKACMKARENLHWGADSHVIIEQLEKASDQPWVK